jgi:ubiquinone/menaquinone biosynthesis C-methylase UbiE
MLRIAQSHGIRDVAAAVTPGLPFADRVFDRILAGFVLSHIPSHESGLTDMVRVLRSGGRLGVTAWGSIPNEYREFWQSLAESFIDKKLLADATREALP